MIEESVKDFLLTRGQVTNLVAERIYPGRAPQKAAFPRITFNVVGENEVDSLDGYSGLTETSLQVSCWAESSKTARRLAHAVRSILRGFRGVLSGMTVQGIFPQGRTELVEPPVDGSDVAIYHVTRDFQIWWQDTAPTH